MIESYKKKGYHGIRPFPRHKKRAEEATGGCGRSLDFEGDPANDAKGSRRESGETRIIQK